MQRMKRRLVSEGKPGGGRGSVDFSFWANHLTPFHKDREQVYRVPTLGY